MVIDVKPRMDFDNHIVLVEQLVQMAKDMCLENAPIAVLYNEIQNVLNKHREWIQGMSNMTSTERPKLTDGTAEFDPTPVFANQSRSPNGNSDLYQLERLTPRHR